MTPRRRAAPCSRQARAPAPRAPWRGGSNTTASKRSSSLGNERAAEQIAHLRFDRLEALRRRGGALERGDRGLVSSAAMTRALLGEPQRERADAGRTDRRSISRRRNAPRRSCASAASPSAVACRNAAGGSCTVARAHRNVGVARWATSSPWRVRRARRCAAATRASAAVAAAVSGPEPRTSMSSPASVAVTWMSSGFRTGISASAIAQAASIAPSRPGARIGQRSIGMMRCARARRKADLEHVMRAAPGMKHGAAAAVAMGVDEVVDRRVDAGLRQRGRRRGRASRRDRAPHSSAAARSRRRCRNAGRSGRCAPRSAPRLQADGGDRDGRASLDLDALAGQRRRHVERPGRACRRRRRRDGRGGR